MSRGQFWGLYSRKGEGRVKRGPIYLIGRRLVCGHARWRESRPSSNPRSNGFQHVLSRGTCSGANVLASSISVSLRKFRSSCGNSFATPMAADGLRQISFSARLSLCPRLSLHIRVSLNDTLEEEVGGEIRRTHDTQSRAVPGRLPPCFQPY